MKTNLDEYIKANTVQVGISHNSEDIGQITVERIKKMIPIAEKMGIYFSFSRELDYLDPFKWEHRYLKADENWLFVFPNVRDLSDFWREVDKEIPLCTR